MTWAKVDDRFHGHSKARRAREAVALWVLALSWCADELTDGVVPADMPELLLPGLGDTYASRLVEVGLWERGPDNGYRFHDWADYQPSARAVKAERSKLSAARSKAGRAGMASRWAKRDLSANSQEKSDNKPHNKPITNAYQNDNPVPVPVPVPDQRELASQATRAREALFEDVPKASGKPPKPRRDPTPPPDPVPATGTPARRLYDAITQDRVLGPITRAPGDLAERLAQPDAYPGIDVLAEVRKAGAWIAGQRPGHWTDGRRGILSWLNRVQERVRSMPKPAPQGWVKAAERAQYPDEEIDWFAPKAREERPRE